MTELKGIKLEDLNVTKETYINLICLLNPDLELPDDERIIFEEEVEKCESGQVIAFYHLLVYGDNLYNFCLSFFSSSLSGNSFYLSGYNVDTCDISKQYLLDCLYKSGILTSPPVEDENTSEPEQPEEDAEEPAEENKQADEIIPNVIEMPLCVFLLMQSRVNDYIDDNDIMEKYGDKDIPCGVMVKIMDYSPQSCFKCEIYDDTGEEPEARSLKVEPLTPLEEAVFEEIEDCFKRYNEYAELARTAEYNGESAEEIARYGHLANEQIFNSDYLKELISKAGLDETYQAWLKERKKQEAVTVL